MSYKHILVAVDLSLESRLVLEKAVALARSLDADLSLFHDDLIYGDEIVPQIFDPRYAVDSKKREIKEPPQQLQELIENAGYPIKSTYIGSGRFADEIEKAAIELQSDLVVCGHHHDFWHRISSSAKQLLKSSEIDMLVIPLK